MTKLRKDVVEELVRDALRLPLEERDALLESRCAGDRDLHAEVRSLLDVAASSEASRTATISRGGSVSGKSPAARSRIGPYVLLEAIGAGGMGSVFLAQRNDDQFRKRVAIKLLRPGLDTEDVVRRFRQERQILARSPS